MFSFIRWYKAYDHFDMSNPILFSVIPWLLLCYFYIRVGILVVKMIFWHFETSRITWHLFDKLFFVYEAFLWMGSQFGCSRTTRKMEWLTLRPNPWRYTQAFGKLMTGPRKAVAWRPTGATHHSEHITGTSTTKAHVAGHQTWHGWLVTETKTRGCGPLSITTRSDRWTGCKKNSWSTTIVPITRGSLRVLPRSVTFENFGWSSYYDNFRAFSSKTFVLFALRVIWFLWCYFDLFSLFFFKCFCDVIIHAYIMLLRK